MSRAYVQIHFQFLSLQFYNFLFLLSNRNPVSVGTHIASTVTRPKRHESRVDQQRGDSNMEPRNDEIEWAVLDVAEVDEHDMPEQLDYWSVDEFADILMYASG